VVHIVVEVELHIASLSDQVVKVLRGEVIAALGNKCSSHRVDDAWFSFLNEVPKAPGSGF
jgi:hypothetical protein